MLTVMASYGYHGQRAAGIGPDCLQVPNQVQFRFSYHGQRAAGIGPDCLQVPIQVHYSPCFTTRKVSQKQ